jgi:hypothetical protein
MLPRIDTNKMVIGYIVRLRREREDQQRLQSAAYSGPGYHNPSHTFTHHNSFGTSNHYNPSYSQRSGYGRGRGGGRGRGYTPFHPYARPYTAPRFAQSSIAFNGTGNATEPHESIESEDTSQAPADSTTSSSGDHQQTEPPRLCATFTSTGISTKQYFGTFPCSCAFLTCL